MKAHTLKYILITACIIALPIWARFDTMTDLYARDMTVIKVDYDSDIVTLVDNADFTWEWKGCEDWYEGDKVACLMDRNGTAEIFNDSIVKMSYQGY